MKKDQKAHATQLGKAYYSDLVHQPWEVPVSGVIRAWGDVRLVRQRVKINDQRIRDMGYTGEAEDLRFGGTSPVPRTASSVP